MTTKNECPTCGGVWPCDRCTTRAVDLDALKARLAAPSAAPEVETPGRLDAWESIDGFVRLGTRDDDGFHPGHDGDVFDLVETLRAELEEKSRLVRELNALLDADRADLAAARAALASRSVWLIEQLRESQTHYWTGRLIDGQDKGVQWSTDPDKARHFARREDAECMLTWHLGGVGAAREHMFVARAVLAGDAAAIRRVLAALAAPRPQPDENAALRHALWNLAVNGGRDG